MREQNDGRLRQRLRELAAERRRFDCCRLGYLLAREDMTPKHKMLLWVHREENLWVGPSSWRRKRTRGTRAPMVLPDSPNQRWSLDCVSDTLACGRQERQVEWRYIAPGRSMQTSFIERLACQPSANVRLRDKCLNDTPITWLVHARFGLNARRHDCNHVRPHSKLGGKITAEIAGQRRWEHAPNPVANTSATSHERSTPSL